MKTITKLHGALIGIFCGLFCYQPLLAKEKINIKGSSTIFPIAKEASKIYGKKSGNIVLVKGGGSSFGVKHALAGEGIGMASRSLKDKEKAEGAHGTVIGLDGIAVIVHPENALSDLSKDQLKGIFSGSVKDWQDIKGSGLKGPIHLMGPNSDHGTHAAFLEIVEIKGEMPAGFQGFKAHLQTMSMIAGDKSSIGWVPMGDYLSKAVDQKTFNVRAFKVDGIDPTLANVKNQTYPIVRPLNLVTKGPPTGDAKAFVDFMLSADGQKIVADQEFVPVGDVAH